MSAPPVIVCGAGLVGLSAAALLRRALPQHPLLLLDLPLPDPDAETGTILVDRGFRRFAEAAGLDLPRLLADRRIDARPMLAVNPPAGAAFAVPSEGEVPHVDGVALHQLWLRREREGAAPPPFADLLEAPPAEAAALAFDGAGFARLLRALLRHQGVEPTPAGQIRATPAADGGTEGVAIDGGPPVRPHLVVDAAGGLMGRTPWQDEPGPGVNGGGRHLLPFAANRLAAGDAALVLGRGCGMAFAAAIDDLMIAADALLLSPLVQAEARRRMAIHHGYRLDWASARRLKPDPRLPEGARLPGRQSLPPGLASLLREFTRRGRIPFRDADPVAPISWLALLIGVGLRPRRIDPTALAPATPRIDRLLRQLAHHHPQETV